MLQPEPKEFKLIQEACSSPITYAIFIILAFWAFIWNINLLPYAIIFSFLLSLMIKIDLKYMILPDSLNILLLFSGFLCHYLMYNSLIFSVLGALFGFILFFSIFYITYKIKGEPSMGFGDVKFITALGAWVGLTGVPLVLLWASLMAGVYVILKILILKKFNNQPFAYGPFLAIAGWLTFLYSTWSWAVILNIREKLLGIL